MRRWGRQFAEPFGLISVVNTLRRGPLGRGPWQHCLDVCVRGPIVDLLGGRARFGTTAHSSKARGEHIDGAATGAGTRRQDFRRMPVAQVIAQVNAALRSWQDRGMLRPMLTHLLTGLDCAVVA